jgi:hypothetical protein
MNCMYEFLTLAITETDPVRKDFSVLAMDVKTKDITIFNLKKEDIVSIQDEVFWDIGFTTFVEEVIYPSNNNNRTVSGVKFGKYMMNRLRNILEAKSTNPDEFFKNESIDYRIVKVLKIDDIITKTDSENYGEDVRKHYLKVYIFGRSTQLNPSKILVKDYRWIKYWNYVISSSEYNIKKDKYLKLFNNKNKTIYFIFRRMKFSSGTHYWIAGIHWL